MSDQSKVRLVRCPKCENLLPELADYSVYQCGGCGAVLRAKNKNVEADTLSEKSEEERVEGVSVKFSEKSDNLKFSEKGMMDLSDGSENGVKSSGISSRRTHKRMVLSNDLEVNEKIDESSNAEMSKQFEESKPPNGIAFRSRRSERVSDWRSGEGGGSEGFWRNPRRDVEAGPSNYHFRSSYGYGELGSSFSSASLSCNCRLKKISNPGTHCFAEFIQGSGKPQNEKSFASRTK
ncbi:protein ENHANCED DISEASE RESISTANCE 4-like [Camellia sinensis]|uniref:protein ENHANCED DISEASE RESISTANCE 4-like n=1 Tax=Camellia sinensis TaxID=4442 RepID=UPI0010363AA1|nr:protein ENHANCED DISEASE RESISTANCE 4-like [Camellia sinensis]